MQSFNACRGISATNLQQLKQTKKMWQIFGLLTLVTIACADVSHLGYHYAKPAESARIMLFPHNKPSPAITQHQHIDYSTMLLEDTKSSEDKVAASQGISEPPRVFLPPLATKDPVTADEPAKDLLAPHEEIKEHLMTSQAADSEETNPFFKEHSSYPASEHKYPKQSIPIVMKMSLMQMLPIPEHTYIPPGKEVTKTPEQKIITMQEQSDHIMLENNYIPPSSETEKHITATQENAEKLKEISILPPAKEPSSFLKPPVNEEIKSFEVPQTDYLPPQSSEKPAKQPIKEIMTKTVPVTSYIPPAAKQENPLKTLIIEVPDKTYLPASQKSSKPAVTPIKEVKLLNYPEKHTAQHEQIILMVQNGYLPAEKKEYRPSMPLEREVDVPAVNVKAQNPFLHHSPTAEEKEYQPSMPLERKVDVPAAKELNPFLHHSPIVMPKNSNVLRQDKSFKLPEMEDILFMEQPIENVPISIDIPNYAKVLESDDFVGPSAFGSSK